MNHDHATFGDDALQFNPDRFLDEKGEMLPSLPGAKEDGHYTFGGLNQYFRVRTSADSRQVSGDGKTGRPRLGLITLP